MDEFKLSKEEVNSHNKKDPDSSGLDEFKLHEDDVKALSVPESSFLDKLGIGTRSAVDSATLGLSEPIVNSIGASASLSPSDMMTLSAGRADLGIMPEEVYGEDAVMQARQNQFKNYQNEIDQRKKDIAENPGSHLTGSLVGAFAPNPVNLGSKVASFGAKSAMNLGEKIPMASRLLKENKDATGLYKIMSEAAKGGVEGLGAGAVAGGASSAIHAAAGEGNASDIPADMLEGGIFGAKFGAGMRGGISAIREAPAMVVDASKKAMTTVLGPKRESIDAYLGSNGRLKGKQSADEMRSLEGDVSKFVGDVRNEVESGKISVSDAKDKLRTAEQDKKQQLQNIVNEYRSVKAPTHKATDLTKAVGQLRQKVSNKSSEAFDVLATKKVGMSRDAIVNHIDEALDNLTIGKNGAVVGDIADAQVRSLNKLKEQVSGMPQVISPVDSKKIMMSLDKDASTWSSSNQSYFDPAAREKRAIRTAIDRTLKEMHPEYAAKMQEVAEEARLLSKFDDVKDIESATSYLSSLNSPKDRLKLEPLKKISESTGNDLSSEAESFVSSRDLLSNPRRDELLGSRMSENNKIIADANNELESSQHLLGLKQQKLDKLGNVSQSGVEGLLKRGIETEKNYNPQRDLQAVSNEMGEGANVIGRANDIKTLKAFEGGNTNGSRNVVLGGTVGAFLLGPAGAAGGASAGAVVDKYGPKIARYILDNVNTIKQRTASLPMSQRVLAMKDGIEKSNLPNYVKSDLIKAMSQGYANIGTGHEQNHVVSDQQARQKFIDGH